MKIFAVLCIAMVFSYTIDFGTQNWFPLYLEQNLMADKAVATVYTIFGLIARRSADFIVLRFGETKT